MSNASFLPEDYLAQKAERRTNIISLTLFGVVMIAVVGAFFVTNRQVRTIRQLQESINRQYQEAAVKIDEMKELDKQKEEMYHKAELAAALVERVPRSILLAELINRMPERLALLEFDLKSERIRTVAPPPRDSSGRLRPPARGKTKEQAEKERSPKVEPPKYNVMITMLGIAPTDLEVSRYMQELNAYPLVRDVRLEFSEQKEVEGRRVRQFKIHMALNETADVRRIDPLTVPRIKNPMTDEVQFNPPAITNVPMHIPGMEGR